MGRIDQAVCHLKQIERYLRSALGEELRPVGITELPTQSLHLFQTLRGAEGHTRLKEMIRDNHLYSRESRPVILPDGNASPGHTAARARDAEY